MERKRVLVLVNPKSGRGRAQRLADEFSAALAKSTKLSSSLRVDSYSISELGEISFDRYNAVVTFGGDGTVLAVATALFKSERLHSQESLPALYPVPCGNENLLSKFLRIDSNSETLLHTLEHHITLPLTVGVVTSAARRDHFLSMCSAGFDAAVIERLAATRTGGVSHTSYLLPILHALVVDHRFEISLSVDGECVVDRAPGLVVFGNTNAYARGIMPVPEADARSEQLCGRFFPIGSRRELAPLLLALARGRPVPLTGSQFFSGKEFSLRSEVPYQCDGEFLGNTPITVSKLRSAGGLRYLNFLTPPLP